MNRGHPAIVETGATQRASVEIESKWSDQMQLRTGVRAQSDHVTRVRWNLGFEEHDMEHWQNGTNAIITTTGL